MFDKRFENTDNMKNVVFITTGVEVRKFFLFYLLASVQFQCFFSTVPNKDEDYSYKAM